MPAAPRPTATVPGPGLTVDTLQTASLLSTCLIRAGAWNAHLPALLPGRLPHLGRGRAALVTERDHVPVRHGRTGTTLREPVPGPGRRGGRSCPVSTRGLV